MKFYVASSWRNRDKQHEVVVALRALGAEVYDFTDPKPRHGFQWSHIDPNWESWTPDQYLEALSHPEAEAGFKSDMDALEAADICVLVMPCGRSAHLELGYAVGAGKQCWILLGENQEPELMYKMCFMVKTLDDLVLGLIENNADIEVRSV